MNKLDWVCLFGVILCVALILCAGCTTDRRDERLEIEKRFSEGMNTL